MTRDKLTATVQYDAILREMSRQDSKWGEQNHTDDRWLCILMEEVGELALAINEGAKVAKKDELTQVAAVAIQWLLALSRRRNGDGHDD